MDILRQTAELIHCGPDRLERFADLVERITVDSGCNLRFRLNAASRWRNRFGRVRNKQENIIWLFDRGRKTDIFPLPRRRSPAANCGHPQCKRLSVQCGKPCMEQAEGHGGASQLPLYGRKEVSGLD